MKVYLAIDFGSTYTKLTAIDMDNEVILATAKDITTVEEDIMIGFNPKFLIDALRVIDDEEINIYMMNPKSPCFIKDDEENYIYLILPVNFNAATV